MELSPSERARAVVRVLLVCLAASAATTVMKLVYGSKTGSLAFLADGIHSLFDSSSTVLGIVSILLASRPPDEGHPYGHKKFETLSGLALAMLLLLAGWEVLTAAYGRLTGGAPIPTYSHWGLVILGITIFINLGNAAFEARAAERYRSQFLESDSLHNRSDFVITLGVLVTVLASRFEVPFVDGAASVGIALYLVFLSLRIIQINVKPLVDSSVLDPRAVIDIVSSIDGVLYCHNVRSRGERWHHFLDLNIHLPGKITLERAHEITHQVEARLKAAFPGLVDVVIHTEPHDHPPCAQDDPPY